MATDPARDSGDLAKGDLWKAPAESTHPSPTDPPLTPPPTAERSRNGKLALVIVGIVVGGLALIGAAVFPITPVLDAQNAKTADTYAKADVSTLGRDIAIYFIDHDGAPPDITVVDGRYHLEAWSAYIDPNYNDEVVSPGVELGGVTGAGPFDWCVWVTNPNGDLKTFRYSAVGGLEAGSC